MTTEKEIQENQKRIDKKYNDKCKELIKQEKQRLFEKQNRLENEILEFIDNQDGYTRSDLQGVVIAWVRANCKL